MTLALKAFTWLVFGVVITALPLFLAAGTIAWPAGWIYLILLYGWLLIGILLLLKYNPGLLAERINISPPNQKAWDKVFVLLLNVFFFAWVILMPLDAVRFHWSWMPLWLQVVGAIALVVSFILISLVFRENSYLSATVRIKEKRRYHLTQENGVGLKMAPFERVLLNHRVILFSPLYQIRFFFATQPLCLLQAAPLLKPDLSGLVSPCPSDRFSSFRSLIPMIPERELGTHEARL